MIQSFQKSEGLVLLPLTQGEGWGEGVVRQRWGRH